jgi:hypothetical protein
MKIKGPFMKVMPLNEVVKHPLFKPNFDIGKKIYSFFFLNIHTIEITQLSMIHMKFCEVITISLNFKYENLFTIILGFF